MKLYTHLNFGGDCEEAFRFYERHLGGTITMMMKASELPPEVKAPGPLDAVIHARMKIAGVELIGNDVPSDYFQPIRSFIFISPSIPRREPRRFSRFLGKGAKSARRCRRRSSPRAMASYAIGSERCGPLSTSGHDDWMAKLFLSHFLPHHRMHSNGFVKSLEHVCAAVGKRRARVIEGIADGV